MKILHIIDHLGFGGAQNQVINLFNCQPNNLNIFLYSLRKTDFIKEIQHPQVFVHSDRRKYSTIPLLELQKLIVQENIEVVHCHLIKSLITGFLLKVFIKPGIKLVYHERMKSTRTFNLYTLIIYLIRSQVDQVIAVSDNTKQLLLKYAKVDPSKIIKLYNFINLNIFNGDVDRELIQKARKHLGIKQNDFVVGFAGRLVQLKGWKEFIQSIPQLLSENKSFKFLIAGDGKDKNEMLGLIDSLNLKEHVFYLGHQDDMRSFYALLDCFVAPSYRESMGLTVIEAKAMGVPVVATKIPAFKETIHDGIDGLLFNIKDTHDLVEKIMAIFSDDILRKKLVKNGLADSKAYSIENYLYKLDNIYKKLFIT